MVLPVSPLITANNIDFYYCGVYNVSVYGV